MAASTKYRGLCETCDQDATCTLKRSFRLEIIHCEQYSTQPVAKNQTPIPATVAAPETADSCNPAALIERN
ncbi:MAG TPA: hypothetical protein VLL97_06040 [Acidobacteriota bacterium]|nr:hypothetical protein [Acidobacteriota bacterium]